MRLIPLLLFSLLLPVPVLAQSCDDAPKTCAPGSQWNETTKSCETVSS
ncbi:hypothetical protein SAMN04488103_102324 [Gemmobacter aquatilis]|uniref:Chitin binding Peritrophin-A domain-containing protein n=1 Tax=Gemmobacter aquatilis TaxID=933059 RepID=A0A1H8C1E3_9RHOB|nr:hypothetical protein [Gemmobacter aquatilis]SEM87897.1 hypothetical protein SAMN04488103_102324 [Gemmobacter aquatilis]